MRRLLAIAILAGAFFAAPRASAFVPPRQQSSQLRDAMLGRWTVLTERKKGAGSVLEPNVLVELDRDTLRISDQTAGEMISATWRVLEEDGDMLAIEVETESGKTKKVDVLVEGGDALTFYVTDDDGDDEEVLRLERAD